MHTIYVVSSHGLSLVTAVVTHLRVMVLPKAITDLLKDTIKAHRCSTSKVPHSRSLCARRKIEDVWKLGK